MDILIAFLLYIATVGLYNRILHYVKSPIFSAFLSIILLILILVVPLFFLMKNIISLASSVNPDDFSAFVNGSKEQILSIFNRFPVIEGKIREIFNNISPALILSYGLNFSSELGKSSLGFIVNIGFITVFLFFYFLYGEKAYEFVIELIPFENAQIERVCDEVISVIKVVFYTSLLNIFLQGSAFGIMIVYFGYDGWFLGMLYGLSSLVPIVGGVLVWLPVSCYEFYLGHTQNAIIIALYALGVCAIAIDNVIKPLLIALINKKILKTSVQINELLIFFAILAGLTSFGFWGIVLGPALTALFISLLRIYRKQTNKQSLP